jgi:hypothetical protein
MEQAYGLFWEIVQTATRFIALDICSAIALGDVI